MIGLTHPRQYLNPDGARNYDTTTPPGRLDGMVSILQIQCPSQHHGLLCHLKWPVSILDFLRQTCTGSIYLMFLQSRWSMITLTSDHWPIHRAVRRLLGMSSSGARGTLNINMGCSHAVQSLLDQKYPSTILFQLKFNPKRQKK